MSVKKDAQMFSRGFCRSVEERGLVRTLLLPPVLIPCVAVGAIAIFVFWMA